MLDSVLNAPRLSIQRLAIALLAFVGLQLLNYLKIGILFGNSIWPLGIVWILAGCQKFGPDWRIVFWIFGLGLFMDAVFADPIGLNGACGLLALLILWGFNKYSPIVASSRIFLSSTALAAYLVSLIVIGTILGSMPNIIGLIIPSIVTIALTPFMFALFNIEGSVKNE